MNANPGGLISIGREGEVVVEAVAAERLIEGNPVTTTINGYEREGHTFVGEWAATPGAWRVSYDEWEFCQMLEGVCEIVPDGGAPQRYRPGDAFVIEPGFRGVWRVIEAMRKRYVIRL